MGDHFPRRSLVQHIQHEFPQMPVAMITAHGSMESAVEALKAGAFDFVSKPVDLRILRRLVEIALKLDKTACVTLPCPPPPADILLLL